MNEPFYDNKNFEQVKQDFLNSKADKGIITPEKKYEPKEFWVFYPPAPQPTYMTTPMLEYQAKTVSWCLYHEQVVSLSELEINFPCPTATSIHHNLYCLPTGQTVYFDFTCGKISTTRPEFSLCKGGIIADEMGLGKTIMSIALVCSTLDDQRLQIKKCKDLMIRKQEREDQEMIDETPVKKLKRSTEKLRKSTEKFKHKAEELLHQVLQTSSEELNDLDCTDTPKKKIKKKKPIKTASQIAFEQGELMQAGTLIVVLAGMRIPWYEEFNKHTNGLVKTAIWQGKHRHTIDPADLDVLIISFTALMNEFKNRDSKLYKYKFYRQILDEAHVIRSGKTATAQACLRIHRERSWCLTGTPYS